MTIHYLKLKRMSKPVNDPLLPVLMEKLNSIEKSIEKLAAHVAVQNGRIGKLEKAEAEERAVTEHIDREIQAHNAEANRRSHLMVGAMSAVAAIAGGVAAVLVQQWL